MESKITLSLKHYGIFVLIICIALVLRLSNLGSLPLLLNQDEAAIAYNAYLLNETGTDEWGKTWPLTLQSFGDYKLIGYPAVLSWLFNFLPKNDFVVRLPAALAGTCLVLLGVFWSRAMKHSFPTQVLIAVFLTTSPVFFFYSRMAFEALLALVLVISSLLLLFSKQMKSNRILFDIGAVLLWCLAAITYNTPLLLLPFVVVILIWWRGVLHPKQWILPTVLLIGVGVLIGTQLMAATIQKAAITVFSDPGIQLQANEFDQQVPVSLAWLARPKVYIVLQVVKRCFQSFGLSFLVIRGGAHPWHALPFWGHQLFIQYVVSLLGLLSVFLIFLNRLLKTPVRKVFQPLHASKNGFKILSLVLLFVGLAPAVVTVDAPHATRSLLFLFIMILMAGEGVEQFNHICKKLFYKDAISAVVSVSILLITILSAIRYQYAYFYTYPSQHPSKIPVGFDIAIQTVALQYPEDTVAVVDQEGTLYVYTSWYLQLQPEYFFETIKKQQPTQIGFRYGEQVGNFHFIASPVDRTTEVAILEYTGETWLIRP